MFLFELFNQKINEVPMTPRAFAASAAQASSSGIKIGFEFEVLVKQDLISAARDKQNKETPIFSPNWLDAFNKDVSDLAVFFKLKKSVKWNDQVFRSDQPNSLNKLVRAWYDYLINEFYKENFQYLPDTSLTKKRILRQPPRQRAAIFWDTLNYGIRNPKIKAAEKKLYKVIGDAALFLKQTLDYAPDQDPMTIFNWRDGTSVERFKNYVRRYSSRDDDDDDDDEYSDEYNSQLYDYPGAAKVLKPALENLFGSVKVFHEYHQLRKAPNTWYIEPDGSLSPRGKDGGAEIVSPPMPYDQAMQAYDQVIGMARQLKLYTNESTGLHVNISIPSTVDVLKLAVLLGDQYVLNSFGRIDSAYAQSVIGQLSDDNRGRFNISDPKQLSRLAQIAKIAMREHFSSINIVRARNAEYFSFRQVGGDYLANAEQVKNTINRFVHVLLIASDPDAYKEDYIRKLVKIVGLKRPAPKTEKQISNYKNNIMINLRGTGIPVIWVVLGPDKIQSNRPAMNRLRTARSILGPGSGDYSSALEYDYRDKLHKIIQSSRLDLGVKSKLINNPGKRLLVVYPDTYDNMNSFLQHVAAVDKINRNFLDSPRGDGIRMYRYELIKPSDPAFNTIANNIVIRS